MKIKAGDTVIFGDGRKKKVIESSLHTHPYYKMKLTFEDGKSRSYMLHGKHHYGTEKHDIVMFHEGKGHG